VPPLEVHGNDESDPCRRSTRDAPASFPCRGESFILLSVSSLSSPLLPEISRLGDRVQALALPFPWLLLDFGRLLHSLIPP